MKENKTLFDKLSLALIGLGVAAALMFSVPKAGASGAYISFNMTNMLSGTNVITSYPTNSAGTNGLNQQTGRFIYLGNMKENLEVGVQGFLVNVGAATTISLQLVWANSGAQPQVLLGTNVLTFGSTNIVKNDWVDGPSRAYSVVVPIPANTTNWYNWSTNFSGPIYPFLSANWVGIYSISNNIGTGGQWTNADAYAVTKLFPTPLIGQ